MKNNNRVVGGELQNQSLERLLVSRHVVWWMRLFLVLITAIAGNVCQADSTPAIGAARKIALLIGNSHYVTVPQLRNPENDVRLIAQSLRAIGFETTEATNLTRARMVAQVQAFSRAIRPGDVALFYYAGHAVQANGINFLIPADDSVHNAAMLAETAVNANDILAMLAARRDAVRIVVLDACRNNPFARAATPESTDPQRNTHRGLAQIEAPRSSRGMYIAYSTAPGQVAYDGDGKNGPYALALAREIRQPGLTLTEVFQNVRHAVIRITTTPVSEAQIPWDSSSLTENLVLVPGESNLLPSVPALKIAEVPPLFKFQPVEVTRSAVPSSTEQQLPAGFQRNRNDRLRILVPASISIMN